MIQLSENKIFIGLDNRTNVLSCNLESSRPKSAEEKLRANIAANIILQGIQKIKTSQELYLWCEPNLCESILFSSKKLNINTVVSVEHINRGGLAIPNSKDVLEILKIFDPDLFSVRIYFDENRSKLAEELAIDRIKNIIDIGILKNKGFIIDVFYGHKMSQKHLEKETIIKGMEKFINEGISPTLWGIRRTDDELFDKTLIGLANIDNDLNNKCIQEINSNDNPIESKAIGLENFAINGDIFSDTLIAWSTKQMMENEAVENIKSNLESYIDTLSSNRVNKIEIN
jgi:hypothetical protein